MQQVGTNNIQQIQQPSIKSCCQSPVAQNNAQNTGCSQCMAAANSSNTQIPQVQTQQTYPAGYIPPQNMYPQYQSSGQTYQIPASSSGVNIQIFNPSVGTPGGAPTYNVNAPCYPSGYYTGSLGPDGKLYPNNSGVGQQGNNTNNGSIDGNVNTGVNNGIIGNDNNSNNTTNNTTTIQKKETDESKKTEKRKIVELTDDYIRNLESYLDSNDKQVRLNAAKEVYARLEEDDSRQDDKALTALINKMLQDPSREIRFLALTALDGRICKGDDYTVGVLKQMQANNNDPLNQEAADANSILLKMSARQVEKEFEVKDKKDKKANEMSDKFKPEGAKL